jgi:ParB-like chromosome segregation protein Spo0J
MAKDDEYPGMPPAHPLATLLPLEKGHTFARLVESIKKDGLQEPIILLQGQILSGRRRWMACHEAGVKQVTREFKGSHADAYAYVVNNELIRRHIDREDRATVAAKFKLYLKEHPDANPEHRSNQAIADLFGISLSTLGRASKVAEAAPVVAEAVKAGKITLAEGAKVADEPKARQAKKIEEVVAEKKAEEAKKKKAEEASRKKAEKALEAAEAAAEKKGPAKSGSPAYDEEIINSRVGQLVRAVAERHVFLGKGKADLGYAAVSASLNQLIDNIDKWRKQK